MPGKGRKIGLYSPTDGVKVLQDSDFDFGRKKLKDTSCKGPGILKAYAAWCGHCQKMVDCICKLGKTCKKKNIDLTVYVIEANDNSRFAQEYNITAFPTFFSVSEDGVLEQLSTHSLPEVVQGECPSCRGHAAFRDSCFTGSPEQMGGAGDDIRCFTVPILSATYDEDGSDVKDTWRMLTPRQKARIYKDVNGYLTLLLNNKANTAMGSKLGLPAVDYITKVSAVFPRDLVTIETTLDQDTLWRILENQRRTGLKVTVSGYNVTIKLGNPVPC